MLFKNTFEKFQPLRFLYNKLEFDTKLGRNFLLNYSLITDYNTLENEISKLEKILSLLNNPELAINLTAIHRILHQFNDIIPTLKSLENGIVLDDVQFFEIKKSAILTSELNTATQNLELAWLNFNDVSHIIDILDPEKSRIPHFYIYSQYDEKLLQLRNLAKETQDINEREELFFRIQQVEDDVRKKLSNKIRPYTKELSQNLLLIAQLDLLLAKAKLTKEFGFSKPTISNENVFKNLQNPEVAETLKLHNRKFQPVSISFNCETILITGANMGGKSVLLQSLALAQLLFQFGFYVPAEKAELRIFDEIMCSFGDQQSTRSGLSSFATEILTIDEIIKTAKSGKKVLALVDELARTTNPDEGKMIVSGFLRSCKKLALTAIVTTHYSGINVDCKKLRVKGLHTPEDAQSLNERKISDYMDYSLVEAIDDDVPKDAFNIARLLNVDSDFLNDCLL